MAAYKNKDSLFYVIGYIELKLFQNRSGKRAVNGILPILAIDCKKCGYNGCFSPVYEMFK